MTDRIRTLVVLERLRRHAMESGARELAATRAHISTLQADRADLLEHLKNEARLITPEAAPYLGAYLRSVRSEVALIERAEANATPRGDELDAAMVERFRQKETVTLALNRAREEECLDRSRREAAANDALILMRWGSRPLGNGIRRGKAGENGR